MKQPVSAKEKFKAFDKLVATLRDTLERKNHDYGDGNIHEFGDRGLLVRMSDKLSRLKTLMWNREQNLVADESVDDTLRDLASYAIITLLIRKGQW